MKKSKIVFFLMVITLLIISLNEKVYSEEKSNKINNNNVKEITKALPLKDLWDSFLNILGLNKIKVIGDVSGSLIIKIKPEMISGTDVYAYKLESGIYTKLRNDPLNTGKQTQITNIATGKFRVCIGNFDPNPNPIETKIGSYKYEFYCTKKPIEIKDQDSTVLKVNLKPTTGILNITALIPEVNGDSNKNLDIKYYKLTDGTYGGEQSLTNTDDNGISQNDDILEGIYKIKITGKTATINKFDIIREKIKVKGGKITKLNVNANHGKLKINYKTSDNEKLKGSEIFIDDVAIGSSNMSIDSGYKYSPLGDGTHILKINSGRYTPIEKKIKIKGGKTTDSPSLSLKTTDSPSLSLKNTIP